MAEIAAANIARWPLRQEFPVAPRMSEITLEVILRTVIGATDPARLTAFCTPRSPSAAPTRTSPAAPTRWPHLSVPRATTAAR